MCCHSYLHQEKTRGNVEMWEEMRVRRKGRDKVKGQSKMRETEE